MLNSSFADDGTSVYGISNIVTPSASPYATSPISTFVLVTLTILPAVVPSDRDWETMS